jgi:membrane protein implicated in regulation of membrane protease activity
MIRNLLSAIASGLLVFVYLLWWGATKFVPDVTAYAIAGIVAAGGAVLWPVVIGMLLGRRRRSKRDEEIQREVDRQLAEKGQQ